MDNTHTTAIVRKSLPLPTRWLLKHNKLSDYVLDYGCGKCHEINNNFFKADGFDPYFRPKGIEHAHYRTVICNYVLNVLRHKQDRYSVLYDIERLLGTYGTAFISVRNDITRSKKSSKGTWQGVIHLPYKLLHSCAGFKLYEMNKGDYYAYSN